MPYVWTPERIETLERLWPTALAAREIAVVLGTTKNSVIAKANRLKLKPRKVVFIPPAAVKNIRRVHKPHKWKAKGKAPKAMLDLEPNDCRWPLDNGLFCGGHSVDKKPYCREHCEIAYYTIKRKI